MENYPGYVFVIHGWVKLITVLKKKNTGDSKKGVAMRTIQRSTKFFSFTERIYVKECQLLLEHWFASLSKESNLPLTVFSY